jgi:hypothetical protein
MFYNSNVLLTVACVSLVSAVASARIGDTKEEAETRFKAQDTNYLKDKYGFQYASYSMTGFSIKQYYWKGVCVKSIYYKKRVEGGTYEFMMPEIKKLAEIEASGKWDVVIAPSAENHNVYARFQNGQGTILEVSKNKRTVTVEAQAYRDVVENFGKK